MKNNAIALKARKPVINSIAVKKVSPKVNYIPLFTGIMTFSLVGILFIWLSLSPILLLGFLCLGTAAYFGYMAWTVSKIDLNFDGSDISMSDIVEELWD